MKNITFTKPNLSNFSNEKTASTNKNIASVRAENLKILGSEMVIELCVGPSLKILEEEYNKKKIKVFGNDIDARWKKFYPKGKWIIKDCFNINWDYFDTIVFAPPLSKKCSGKREDLLSIEEVNPSYYDFFEKFSNYKNKIGVIVLPGRSLSSKKDRKQFFKLIAHMMIKNRFEIMPIKMKNKITKYVDVYITKK